MQKKTGSDPWLGSLPVFGVLLQRWMEKSTVESSAARSGFPFQDSPSPMRTYANWEQGRSFPSIERLPHIAAFFDVTVDYLLGVNRDTINHRVMDQLAILTPEQRKAVELVLVSMKKEAE